MGQVSAETSCGSQHSQDRKTKSFLRSSTSSKYKFVQSEEQRAVRQTVRPLGDRDFHWSSRQVPHHTRDKEIMKKYGKEIRALGLNTVDKSLKYKTFLNMCMPLLLCSAGLVFVGSPFSAVYGLSSSFNAMSDCRDNTSFPSSSFFIRGYLLSHHYGECPMPDTSYIRDAPGASRSDHCLVLFFNIVLIWVAGIFTHSLFIACHEISHGNCFRDVWWNDTWGMLIQWPASVPMYYSFKIYHQDHHRYLGWDMVDTDVPTVWETRLFGSTLGKCFFVTFMTAIYALRPIFIRPKAPNASLFRNLIMQLSLDALWVLLFGWHGLAWLFTTALFSGGWNPVAGHFISEHYVFDPEGNQETYSYYGFWNIISYNVGYHNEHHDFPGIPGSKLPELHRIAAEYYEPLKQTPSWWATTWEFVRNPHVGTWSRVKRERQGKIDRQCLLPESSTQSASYVEPTWS